MKFLLDTNVISEMTKPELSQAVTTWLGQTPITEVALSVITLGEIQRGILATPSEKKRAALQQWYDQSFLLMFSGGILNITPAVVEEWAERYQAARARGKTPASMDSLIAATAAAHGLTVVTRNESDFEPLDVPLLNIWTTEEERE
ncbi:type II toxin-antitoxin system VapC family toxin [Deinococcus sp. Marseille-Q6407]|uniref:type II toxin-antitoxin system VapC family toxin n=1 Tax=Deinococcus sp. Marseille-Q6407 TaxID=2969223 RepID=UPI0021BEE711|nr:type II toxin-antitoxin system VapC family toxin [Deinococcus sp. Marseille-Q6407]